MNALDCFFFFVMAAQRLVAICQLFEYFHRDHWNVFQSFQYHFKNDFDRRKSYVP